MFPGCILPFAVRRTTSSNAGYRLRLDIQGDFTRAFEVHLFVEWVLRGLPWWLVVILFMAGPLVRAVELVFAVGVLLFIVGILGLWDLTMQTLALVLIATSCRSRSGPIGVFWRPKRSGARCRSSISCKRCRVSCI